MNKVKFGSVTPFYPMPVFIIGTKVGGKPNFMVAAWGTIANLDPPMFSVAIRHSRYSQKGIRENMCFSVNVPSTELVKETDLCGLSTGAKIDKVAACKFNLFYGKLDTAPLIEQCPVNIECKVVHTLELATHCLFIGSVEETHISEACLTDGKVDVNKIRPFVFAPGPVVQYHSLGNYLGKAYGAGKELQSKQP